MKELKILLIAIISVFIFANCGGNHPDQPTSQAEIEAGQKARADELKLSSKDVQGKWELVDVQGEDVDFDMFKGTTLKFDSDAMYKILNDDNEMGIFFIKNIDQTFIYKRM